MKMRLAGFLALLLLSISILSYGFNGTVFADSHNIPPISAKTELPSYENGDRVELNGSIRDYDSDIDSGKALTFVIKSPDGNLVTIGQLTPKSDGSFMQSFVAGGPLWKMSGDYIIEFHFGPQDGQAKIVYTGGEFEAPPPEQKPTQTTCGSNQDLINGKCVDKEPEPVACGSNQDLINGKCVDKEPEPVACGSNQDLINGKCVDKEPEILCGEGTELVDGKCVAIKEPSCPKGYSFNDDGLCVEDKGGCLIATAAYGTELAPQVQFLREIRDNTVMTTSSGASFMTGFNTLYYSFAPTVADWERESPMFKEAVRAFITPMISSLSIMALADDGSEAEVLGLGISVIALNLGMYIAAPALIGFKVHKHFKTRNHPLDL